eukprot:Gregarina_sp_Poly_1__11478@NODE_989_length_5454_cov_5_659922_g695_i0_p2_GENE_NODE_989_length_5454_cov_5_659922_g695_i0NODE_989_length_5454_cov_5_659922_g695_i0_p2_ORF_typecomplete_len139_score13_98CIDR1_gamma/PF18562_1/8_3e03CIDR1_gamma/PF18562_1/0_065_NODE_989_length_5454_cov_5_659922_g695_i0389805
MLQVQADVSGTLQRPPRANNFRMNLSETFASSGCIPRIAISLREDSMSHATIGSARLRIRQRSTSFVMKGSNDELLPLIISVISARMQMNVNDGERCGLEHTMDQVLDNGMFNTSRKFWSCRFKLGCLVCTIKSTVAT